MYTYEKPYYLLFNAITDALRQLEACQPLRASDVLIKAQQAAEEIVISEDAEQKETAEAVSFIFNCEVVICV